MTNEDPNTLPFAGETPNAVRELPRRFLLFSFEAYGDVAYTMREIFDRIAEETADLRAEDYGDEIEEILFTPICMPDSIPCPERKFVSHQKKYADMRLRISYPHFRQATSGTKRLLCLQAILRSIAIIDARTRKNGFRGKELAEELRKRFVLPKEVSAPNADAQPSSV